MSDASPPPPAAAGVPARGPSVFGPCAALAALVALALAGHAAFTGHAWSEGYRGPFMPVWRAVLAFAFAWIATRTARGERWAAVFGPAFVVPVALGTLLWALAGPWWAWPGLAVLLVYASVTWASVGRFPRADAASRGRSTRLALLALFLVAGAEVYGHFERPGSAYGRQLVVAEFDRAYHDAGARDVRVELKARELRIISTSDSDARIRAFAKKLHQEYVAAGPKARVWLVGFDEVTVTNGKIMMHLPAAEFVKPTSDPLETLFPGDR